MSARREDLSRLPVWAQNRIYGLESQVKALLGQLNAAADTSDTFRVAYPDMRQPLGKGSRIRFITVPDSPKTVEQGYEVRLDGNGVLDVRSTGTAMLSVHSEATNHVRVGEWPREVPR